MEPRITPPADGKRCRRRYSENARKSSQSRRHIGDGHMERVRRRRVRSPAYGSAAEFRSGRLYRERKKEKPKDKLTDQAVEAAIDKPQEKPPKGPTETTSNKGKGRPEK